ncbi:MAG: response regulator [Nitrospirae bacterium]|nr:MAG: response regulator [Nitrospirota bacterium]
MKHAESAVKAESGSERVSMGKPIRILHLEDNRNDAELIQALLAEDGLACEIVRAESRADFAAALGQGGWDLFLSDNTLPSFSGMAALALVRERCPDVPFIFISGTIGEEVAIESLKKGATDYVLKQRPARLASAVRRALREKDERVVQKRATEAMLRSEAMKSAVLRSSLDAIITIDQRGLILEFNPAAEATFGYRRDEVMGKPMAELIIPPSLREKQYRDLAQYLAAGQGPVLERGKEIIAMRADETEFPVELAITRIGLEGVPIFTAFIRDISELKRAEKEKENLEAQFRQAQKMEAVGQLTGGIAHDFNNLLTIINGYTEMLLQTLPAGDPQRDNAAQVKEAGDRAVALTRQLLAFSRRQMLEPKVLDLNAVVTNIDKMLTRMIGEDITLTSTLMPRLGRVKADPGQIEQVIMNLAVNARDAMPQGGKLTIETTNVELDENFAQKHAVVKPGRYVMLAVSDTGCGMNAETQQRIFEPFFTTKGLGKGTGLGLATTYGIVKQSGGSIWVYSEVGQGTTFKVYLPRVDEKPDAVLPGAVGASPLQGTETILLVEDDAPLRKLTHAILRKGGYAVLSAGHGDEAFRVCAEHTGPIHLLVSDVVMPGMGGHELAERLKSAHPDMKVLYVSGYTDDTVVRHGVLNRNMAFLQKPFTMHGLLRKVREVLDAPRNSGRN